jgi:hypothetical protein
MSHDLEAKGRNWHKELPSVLWALQTNINRATKDTSFNLVYGADAVLPPQIYLDLARVVHFNEEKQVEARQLNSNLLEERHKTTLSNELKKDIRTKDKHKFSLPWDGPFILVDIAAPGAYVLPEVDGALLPNTWNADQWCKYYA